MKPGNRPPNIFSLPGLDRASDLRNNDRWLSDQLARPDTMLLPVWQDMNLFAGPSGSSPRLIPSRDAAKLLADAESVTFLGHWCQRAHFAVGIPAQDGGVPPRTARQGVFRDLRQVAALLAHKDGALLAYARAMVYWHRRHRFCGDCGSPTVIRSAGHLRVCTNPACAQEHFPRTDPAVITLVTSGEQCLFGRKRGWTDGLYSIIAGFVEPGESLEATVCREVFEETGIRVGDISYQSSQPWPFPSSLMLGFRARALGDTIQLRDGELEDARWLSRTQVIERVRLGRLQLPSSASISWRLISEWFDADGDATLRDVLQSLR